MKNEICIEQVMQKIPHRYPFLLIDKVVSWNKDEDIVAKKNVSINEPFFQGHFPGKPVMPGVLIIEALAQTAAILAYLSQDSTYKDFICYLASIENARFKQVVTPGDTLLLQVNYLMNKQKFWKVDAQAFVDEKLVCSCQLMSARGS